MKLSTHSISTRLSFTFGGDGAIEAWHAHCCRFILVDFDFEGPCNYFQAICFGLEFIDGSSDPSYHYPNGCFNMRHYKMEEELKHARCDDASLQNTDRSFGILRSFPQLFLLDNWTAHIDYEWVIKYLTGRHNAVVYVKSLLSKLSWKLVWSQWRVDRGPDRIQRIFPLPDGWQKSNLSSNGLLGNLPDAQEWCDWLIFLFCPVASWSTLWQVGLSGWLDGNCQTRLWTLSYAEDLW